MNDEKDVRGLILEIKSLKDDIELYKGQLEVANYKFNKIKKETYFEIFSLKEKIKLLDKKTKVTKNKAELTEPKEVKILYTTIGRLENYIEKLKEQIKLEKNSENKIKTLTKKSTKKLLQLENSHYLSGIIEEIIETGELLPSVALRIRKYTKSLNEKSDLSTIQPLLEELIFAFNKLKKSEKEKLKLK